MTLFHSPFGHSYLHKLMHWPKGDVGHLILSGVARKVAQVFLYLFSAVYVYEIFIELGLEEKRAIIMTLSFYFVQLIVKTIFIGLAEDLSRKVGFKGMIWLSSIPFLLFIFSFVNAAESIYLIYLSAALWGAHASFYWWGYHGYFIKKGDKLRFGQGVGEAEALNTLAAILTPIVGAVLINYYGFSFGFYLAGFFMIISLFLLGRDHDSRQKHDIVISDVLGIVRRRKAMSMTYVASGVEGFFYVFGWPLFLLSVFGEVVSLGKVVSIATFIAALLAIFIGRWVDKHGEEKVMLAGSPLMSLSWLIKMMGTTLPVFVVGESIRNFGERMLFVPMMELTYKKASEKLSARAIMYRELMNMSGAMISVLIIAVAICLGFGLRDSLLIISLISLVPMASVLLGGFKNG